MTLVYLVDVSAVEESTCAAAFSLLPGFRKEKARHYLRLKDRVTSVFSYLLLKKAFQDLGEDISSYEMKYTELGKPYFETSDYQFSLSHSYPYIAVAVSKDKVGVDVEKIKKHTASIATRFFTKEETESISCDADFIRLWTLKEAMSKLTGEGIVKGLDHYEFAKVFPFGSFQKYDCYFSIHSSEDYVLSVAKEKEEETFLVLSLEFNKDSFEFKA